MYPGKETGGSSKPSYYCAHPSLLSLPSGCQGFPFARHPAPASPPGLLPLHPPHLTPPFPFITPLPPPPPAAVSPYQPCKLLPALQAGKAPPGRSPSSSCREGGGAQTWRRCPFASIPAWCWLAGFARRRSAASGRRRRCGRPPPYLRSTCVGGVVVLGVLLPPHQTPPVTPNKSSLRPFHARLYPWLCLATPLPAPSS